MHRLAARLDALGQAHSGMHRASFGWILPEVPDPDGHPIRFYTIEHHTDLQAADVSTVNDPRESAQRRERRLRVSGQRP